jgi:hypothetical protein
MIYCVKVQEENRDDQQPRDYDKQTKTPEDWNVHRLRLEEISVHSYYWCRDHVQTDQQLTGRNASARTQPHGTW